MTSFFLFLRNLLRTPDAQQDAYLWACVLLSHAMLGVALGASLPLVVAVLGYAIWEAVQWWRFRADPWDCLLDMCAFYLGVTIAVSLQTGYDALGAVVALGVVLFAGVRVRA